jgi:hypothetical protein
MDGCHPNHKTERLWFLAGFGRLLVGFLAKVS